MSRRSVQRKAWRSIYKEFDKPDAKPWSFGEIVLAVVVVLFSLMFFVK